MFWIWSIFFLMCSIIRVIIQSISSSMLGEALLLVAGFPGNFSFCFGRSSFFVLGSLYHPRGYRTVLSCLSHVAIARSYRVCQNLLVLNFFFWSSMISLFRIKLSCVKGTTVNLLSGCRNQAGSWSMTSGDTLLVIQYKRDYGADVNHVCLLALRGSSA
jgi:hypothetical protein